MVLAWPRALCNCIFLVNFELILKLARFADDIIQLLYRMDQFRLDLDENKYEWVHVSFALAHIIVQTLV